MHSFHHSRGRVLFEVACALTISASCVAAWMDLGIPAFLAAAAASGLYAFIHLFDVRRPRVAAVAAPAVVIDETQGDLLAYVDAPAPAPPAGPAPSLAELVEEAAPVEEPAPVAETKPIEESAPAPAPRAKKRRSSKKAQPVAEVEPVVESESVDSGTPLAEVELTDESEPFEAEPTELEPYDEPEEHAPVTPLFEPEPFVRQQRAVFGRKAS
jgi:hypothetical protein